MTALTELNAIEKAFREARKALLSATHITIAEFGEERAQIIMSGVDMALMVVKELRKGHMKALSPFRLPFLPQSDPGDENPRGAA